MVSTGGDESRWRAYAKAARRRLTPSKNTIIFLETGTIALLVILLVGQMLAGSPPDHYSRHADGYQYGKEKELPVFQVLALLWVKLGEWLRTHYSAVEAFSACCGVVFSAVLTYWNILLWRETRDAARAGARQADIAERALVDLEAPSVFLEIDQEFSETEVVTMGAMSNHRSTIRIPGNWYYRFVNYGRTPAFLNTINEQIVELSADALPPSAGESQIILPRGVVVPPSGTTSKFYITSPATPITSVPDLVKIREGIVDTRIFLSICCRFRDLFGNEFLAGFCYASETKGIVIENFRPIDGDGYNYIRQVKSGMQDAKDK